MRNFDHESWRPLFLREPVAQRGSWDVTTRGLRDYLIRLAEDDGTLLKHCAEPLDELAANLTTRPHEHDAVRCAIETLLRDGFLRWDGSPGAPGWLGVDRLVTLHPHSLEERVQELRRLVTRLRRAAQRVRPIVPGDVCAYCGRRTALMTIDHVVPICQGGTNDPDNLVPACMACNARKGGRTPEQARMEVLF